MADKKNTETFGCVINPFDHLIVRESPYVEDSVEIETVEDEDLSFQIDLSRTDAVRLRDWLSEWIQGTA